MNLVFDSIKIAFSSLWAKKARSFLSILGIVIGILTVAGLLSIALGVRNQITSSIEDLGSNLVFVAPGKITGNGGSFASQLGASTLTEKDFESIKLLDDVKLASMAMIVTGTVKSEAATASDLLIYGSSPGLGEITNLELSSGRFNDQNDGDQKARIVVLGSAAAKNLFGDNDPVGQKITIRGENFEVVGVLKEKSTAAAFGGPDLNNLVIIPIETAWEITGTKQIFRINMQAKDADSIESLKTETKKVILANHGGEEDFSVLSQDDLVSFLGDILNILTAMLAGIAAISLLVGGVGIMNIMLVSVSERTREIGIRKAVGATRGAILLQFLIESVILTLVGGSVAMIIFSAAVLAAKRFSPIPVDFDPMVISLSLIFSAVIGIIFGLVPAIGASRKNPIDALRYE